MTMQPEDKTETPPLARKVARAAVFFFVATPLVLAAGMAANHRLAERRIDELFGLAVENRADIQILYGKTARNAGRIKRGGYEIQKKK